MFANDDARRLWLREEILADELERRDADPPIGAPTLLARTKSLGAYPTVPQCFFACQPLTLLGAEVEGGPGDLSEEDATFFALNFGTTIPAPGTLVLTTFIGSRWVFRHDA